jgi:hypothetical protein
MTRFFSEGRFCIANDQTLSRRFRPWGAGSRLAFSALLLFSVLTCLTGRAGAQILYGSLTGTVQDKSGAIVPGASVTLTNQGTGDVRTTQASSTGTYSFLDVLPGAYTVSIPASGNFASYAEKNVLIEVNRQVRVDAMLQPGTVSTAISVTEAPPALQTETAEVNAEISSQEITELPITSTQGRSFQALYTLIPGAAAVAEQNSTGSNPSRAESLNVNGTSYNGNTTRIDGAVNYYGWLPYLIAYVPPADSVENVSITTNSFNAEQGQAGGASIKITTKSGTRDFHGSVWEYYQDAALNARAYINTVAALTTPTDPNGSVPKNVFNQFGFNIGGPVYIPKILTGKKKLFFFDNFERTTRRQLITGLLTVPDANMIAGNFSEANPYTVLYDPQPIAGTALPAGCTASSTVNGYLIPGCRPTFTQEYVETGNQINTIPTSRLSFAAATMIANLSAISASIGTPSASLLSQGLANDYTGRGTLAYTRKTNDAKITFIPSERTQIFGKYSIEPFTVADPQELGPAGGGTFDGGQPGAAAGRVQNVGMGVSHVFSSRLVMDADFGYTRQVTGAQSTLDIADGDYGLNVLHIPGTNGVGPQYVGQPAFSFNSTFSAIGDANYGAPFLFRDNQFTGDVNLSWIVGKHTMKYGFTYYHFDLNHFQPTSGGGVSNVRGGFLFAGGLTCTGTTTSCPATAYNTLADYLLGLPNSNGSGNAVQKAQQVFNPNSMRWTELGAYAEDQWDVTPKLVINYGVRYEYYPVAYRDHTGISLLDPTLPQSANVIIGGVNGVAENAGVNNGYGFFAPRLGISYRIDAKTVVRTGSGLTVDPDSMRYLRDSFPWDLDPNYTSSGTGTIAYDPANNNAPMTLSYGIPIPTVPNFSTGVTSLPVSGSTTTIPKNFRRGYLESWNLFVQRDLGFGFVGNIGYVANHFVRQQAGVSPYNAAPLPTGNTSCMANGQYNPTTGLTGACSFQDNTLFSQKFCSGTSNCYNSGGVNVSGPTFSSYYEGMQTQLTRNGGKNSTFGVVYTWSHAMDYEDNGAGTGSGGTTFNYPGYYYLNKGNAGFDRKHNVQVYGVYKLPFGYGQKFVNKGLVGQIVGGFQLNGQFSHISGAPFSVSSNSNVLSGLAPGFGATYAELVAPYQQLGGHNRTFGNTAISGGKAWFNPASFASVVEPTYTASQTSAQIVAPVLPNTGRNEFRGPGQSVFNTSIFRGFHLYRSSEFQIRFEAFNVFNHPLLSNPSNLTVPTAANIANGNYGTFGLVTSFGSTRSLQFGGRINF